MVSVRGNQVFDQFPNGMLLAAGDSVTVTSGPTAKAGPGFLLWTTQSMWSNSGDPGRLLNEDGAIVAQDPSRMLYFVRVATIDLGEGARTGALA